jgi:hypothetical protein
VGIPRGFLREGAGSNRQSRGDIVLVGDHEIEILSIE